KSVIRDVRADAPIGALPRAVYVRLDQLSFAQASDLIINEIQHPIRVTRPVLLRLLLGLRFPSCIAHEDSVKIFPCALEAEVVIHATVAQNHAAREGLPLEFLTAISREARWIEFQYHRREDGGKSG